MSIQTGRDRMRKLNGVGLSSVVVFVAAIANANADEVFCPPDLGAITVDNVIVVEGAL